MTVKSFGMLEKERNHLQRSCQEGTSQSKKPSWAQCSSLPSSPEATAQLMLDAARFSNDSTHFHLEGLQRLAGADISQPRRPDPLWLTELGTRQAHTPDCAGSRRPGALVHTQVFQPKSTLVHLAQQFSKRGPGILAVSGTS